MTKTLARLVGPTQSPTTVGVIYTVPSSGVQQVILTNIVASNNRADGLAVNYSVYVLPAGETFNSSAHSLVSSRTLDPGALPDVLSVNIPLNPGDQIQARASQSGLCVILAGVVSA